MNFSNWIYPKDFIQVTFCDKVASTCAPALLEEGYSVDRCLTKNKEEMLLHLQNKHVVGIRSKTKIREEDFEHLPELLTIGCFCIGTDQVDFDVAAAHGIPVFNAPFGNTRSVAELIVSQLVQLARQAGDRNRECHEAYWGKTHIGCHELRGKKLGIVGYGHVGTQVSILAEAFGMKVFYYDITPKLPLGNATRVSSFQELLPIVDFLTLHVPYTPITHKMIGKKQLGMMKKGSYLLNAARGKCVILEDVADAIKSGKLAGAYFDVYPSEPLTKDNPLLGLPNVILTPHIGGSTEEAQENIGLDCTRKLIEFINEGSTVGAVNFPEVSLPTRTNCHRIINVHRNVPGVLRQINEVLCDYNVAAQILSTKDEIGYLIVDLDAHTKLSVVVKEKLDALEATIKSRVIWRPGMYSSSVTPEPNAELMAQQIYLNKITNSSNSLKSLGAIQEEFQVESVLDADTAKPITSPI